MTNIIELDSYRDRMSRVVCKRRSRFNATALKAENKSSDKTVGGDGVVLYFEKYREYLDQFRTEVPVGHEGPDDSVDIKD